MKFSARFSCICLALVLILDGFGCANAERSSSDSTSTIDITSDNSSTPVETDQPAGEVATWMQEESLGTTPTVESEAASISPTIADSGQQASVAEVATMEEPVQQKSPSILPAPVVSQQQIDAWNLQTDEPLQLIDSVLYDQMGFTQRIVALPGEPRYLLAGSTVSLWTFGSKQPDRIDIDWRGQENVEFRDIAVAPSGEWFVATNSAGMIVVIDLDSGKEMASRDFRSSLVPTVSISPDSSSIATADFGGQVTIWSVDELKEKGQFQVDSRGLKQLLFIAPDRLVAAAESISVWNSAEGTKIQELPGDRYFAALSLSPSGKLFSYGDSDGLRICEVSEFKEVAHLPGSLSLDELVVWQSDQRLACVSGNLIRYWDLPGRRLIQAIDHGGSVLAGACWVAESKVLALASLLRQTRFWSTSADAVTLGKQPLQPEVAFSDPPHPVPATVLQFAKIIDLRTFPRLPDAVPVLEQDSMLRYTTQSSVDDAKLFCRYVLNQAGWRESAADGNSYGSMNFFKSGFWLDCSIMEVPGMGTTVSLTSLGNMDLRDVPRPEGLLESVYESRATCIFSSKSDLLALEAAFLKSLLAEGWMPYSRLSSSSSENPDRRDLTFLKNSLELRVSIGKNATEPDRYNIQYSTFPVNNSIPIPTGCSYVEYNAAPELELVASTRQPIPELIDFFDSAMTEQGWVVQNSQRELQDDRCWLLYSRDQQDITIGLTQLENGWNRITIGDLSSAGSFQLAEAALAEESTGQSRGIEAADLPIAPNAQNVRYQKLEQVVSFDVPELPLSQLIQFYQQKLESLGWTKDGRSLVDEQYCMADFTKGEDEITVRANMRGGVAACNIQGDGLLWTKPLPGPKVTISYEAWLRSNKKVATLDFLDEYVTEMQAIQQTP